MKKFENYKITDNFTKKGKYIYTAAKCSKLVYSTIQKDILFIDIYHIHKKVLTLKTSIKLNSNFQCWKNGVLQTKPLSISLIGHPIIKKSKQGYWSIDSFYSGSPIRKYISKYYNCEILSYENFKTITCTRKKAFKYLPIKYRIPAIYDEGTYYVENAIIITDFNHIAVITDNTIKYYRRMDFVQIPYCNMYCKNDLFKGGVVTNKNLNWKLFLVKNDLISIMRAINVGYITLSDIMKLSLDKKKIINKFCWITSSKIYPFLFKLNVNSYRNEDLIDLIRVLDRFTKNHLDFPYLTVELDFTFLLKNYKKLIQYINHTILYKDYLLLVKECSTISIKKYPTFPTLDKLNVYHRELIKIYNDNQAIIKCNKLKEEDKKYQLIKPELKTLEYNNDKYSILTPNSLQDLIDEGKNLHHCVGSYTEAVCNKKNKIFFLRKNETLNTSWFTIDLTPNNQIRQIHTVCNKCIKDVPEAKEITDFIVEWSLNKEIRLSSDINNIKNCL